MRTEHNLSAQTRQWLYWTGNCFVWNNMKLDDFESFEFFELLWLEQHGIGFEERSALVLCWCFLYFDRLALKTMPGTLTYGTTGAQNRGSVLNRSRWCCMYVILIFKLPSMFEWTMTTLTTHENWGSFLHRNFPPCSSELFELWTESDGVKSLELVNNYNQL